MQNKAEVLAPVGSWEALSAAIQAGCDAVYFGIEQLNMRSRSSANFSTEDMAKIAAQCAAAGVTCYLTLNTVVYDHDIPLMKTIVTAAKDSGVTAVIASDHAVMSHARKIGLPVHVSTQANVSNIDTVEFYSAFADVVVLSRELSLQRVERIVKEIEREPLCGPSGKPIRIEVFVHGALCMAVSGKCYLSLHSHNASANRGACMQNCRREYIVTDKQDGIELSIENEYIMSAKDLCTIDFLDKVVNAGVKVLKIEGRGRSAEYVHTTVSCYREAVDALADGSYGAEKIAQWKERLATVFNRGFWDGYYLGKRMGEWSDTYGSQATERKVFLGKGIKYFPKINVAEFHLETNMLQKGDRISISGPTTGLIQMTVEELRLDGKPVESVSKGQRFSLPVAEAVRPSDRLYKIVPA